jgi:hypothetical protein
MVIAPSIAAIERAADAVKYGRHSEAPVIEAIIPSLTDPELAPVGQHILSAIVQYAPPAAEGGTTAALRQRFAELAMARLDEVMPGIRSLVRAQELLLPEDIQLRTGASGGHWHHGELAFDQMLMLRPVPGAHQYETPIASLYLCGAGCHPGGGVMGADRSIFASRFSLLPLPIGLPRAIRVNPGWHGRARFLRRCWTALRRSILQFAIRPRFTISRRSTSTESPDRRQRRFATGSSRATCAKSHPAVWPISSGATMPAK